MARSGGRGDDDAGGGSAVLLFMCLCCWKQCSRHDGLISAGEEGVVGRNLCQRMGE